MITEVIHYLKDTDLCRRDTTPKDRYDVITWWERRRVTFNLVVGSVGIGSCTVMGVTGLIGEHYFQTPLGIPDPPIMAVLAILIYAIMANVCFTGGWAAELIVRKAWPQQANSFATLSLSLGLLFSVLLTLLPAIVIGAIGILGLLWHLLGLFVQ